VKKGLKIIPGIPSGGNDIFFHISQKCQNKINDDGGSHSEYGGINKILADACGGNAQSLTDGGANSKSIPFYEISETVHGKAKLKNLYNF